MYYAIGDIHGQLDALQLLLKKIEYRPEEDFLYFVGDYVDWGPKSIETLLFMMELSKNPKVNCVLGNHDKMMIDAITNKVCKAQIERGYGLWKTNGGSDTYSQFLAQPNSVQQKITSWMKALPEEIDNVNVNGNKFCIAHATRIVPAWMGQWLTDDYDSERVWHRLSAGEDPFGGFDEFKNVVLICGHTPTVYHTGKYEPYFDDKFIDIDTGAKVLGVRGYEGANLTALKLEDLSYASVK